MHPSSFIRWAERGLYLLLFLAFILHYYLKPASLGPISSVLLRSSVLLIFFLYLAWPWTFSPPLEKSGWWDRTLHFVAPFLWSFNFLTIFLTVTTEQLMTRNYVEQGFEILQGTLNLFVIVVTIQRIHLASTQQATAYFGWILGRTFLIGGLTFMILQ